jgi:nucleotide-binding universal stress UspA family protein
MNKILCATRGGEASQKTQDKVIEMAKEAGATILFLYIVDLEFLKVIARGVRPDVVSVELEHMGEFLLALACERAAAEGVPAEGVLRHGPLVEALESAARDEGADAIAFGRPAGEDSSFTLDDLEALADRIEEDTGIQTHIL